MHDIYLTMGSYQLPDFSDLAQTIPMLTDPELQKKMMADVKIGPHFLGLDLTEAMALELLKRLKAGKATGYLVDSAYRKPTVTREQATAIAERALAEKAKQFPNCTFDAVRLRRSEAMTWTFGASSPEMAAQRRRPGAIFIDVDKLDGHIWQPEEYKHVKRGN